MEKSNPDKPEHLVNLAARRGWEVILVPECSPTSQAIRQQLIPGFAVGNGSDGNWFIRVK